MITKKMIRCARGIDSVAIQTIQDFYSPANPHRTSGLGIVNHFYDIGELTRMVNPFFLLAVSNRDKDEKHEEEEFKKYTEKILGYVLAYTRKRIESLRNGHSSDAIHKNLCGLEGNFLYVDHLALPPKLSLSNGSSAVLYYLEEDLIERAKMQNISALYTTADAPPGTNENMFKILGNLKWTPLEKTIRDESGREFMIYHKDLNHSSKSS